MYFGFKGLRTVFDRTGVIMFGKVTNCKQWQGHLEMYFYLLTWVTPTWIHCVTRTLCQR